MVKWLLVLCLSVVGCATHHVAPVVEVGGHLDKEVGAVVVPPEGWRADPLKVTSKSKHRVWISPSGNTAYGVIFFHLPLPVGEDLAMWGFMDQMKKHEGEANLLSEIHDKKCDCIRFVAEGGLYKVRGNLFTSGMEGWAVYAGTLRKMSVNEKELDLAEKAREITRVGQ